MPSIRFRLDKPTTDGLDDHVRREYGPDARVVDTEVTLVGGVAGFFAKRVVDVTVDLPEPATNSAAHDFGMAKRVGIAALLEEADAAEEQVAPGVDAPALSTQSGGFASVLDGLRIDVEPMPAFGAGAAARPPSNARPAWAMPDAQTTPAPARRAERVAVATRPAGPIVVSRLDDPPAEEIVFAQPVPRSRVGKVREGLPPAQRTRPGDLLVVVGLGDDAVRVALDVRDRLQTGYVCDGGAVEGNTRRRVDDRRDSLAARAYGVRSGQPVIVAYGIADGDVAAGRFEGLTNIDGDQVWAVVDATRKHLDTKRWLDDLRRRVQVDAIASIRVPLTSTPETLAQLGLPEAWTDAR